MNNDLETKTVLANELAQLLTILDMFNTKFQSSITVAFSNNLEDHTTSFEVDDPVLINLIKEYVLKKAKMLDTNYKLTGF